MLFWSSLAQCQWHCFDGGGHAVRGGVGNDGGLHDAAFALSFGHVTAGAASHVVLGVLDNLRCHHFGSMVHIGGCQYNPRYVCNNAIERCCYIVPCLG